MAGSVELSHFSVLLCAAGGVMHVTQVIFTEVIIDMVFDKKLLIDFQKKGKQSQQLYHDF